MTAGLIISMIWPHLASAGKIMCIIRFVNAGLLGRSCKMRRCSWQDGTGAAARGRFGSYILNHLTFGVWGEHSLELINNSSMMTTCNDSFYYGLVNPQPQLCPSRPSASRLFCRVFPPALLSVLHLGSHTGVWGVCLGLIPASGRTRASQGIPGRGFGQGSSVLPGSCADLSVLSSKHPQF